MNWTVHPSATEHKAEWMPPYSEFSPKNIQLTAKSMHVRVKMS